eukprot:146846_1
MSLEYLNCLIQDGGTKIKCSSLTNTRYTNFQQALNAVINPTTEKEHVQKKVLQFLQSQPIALFKRIATIVDNECEAKFQSDDTLNKRTEKYLLELPIAIIPIPCIAKRGKIQKDEKQPTEKYVLLTSKPNDDENKDNYEKLVIKFFVERLTNMKRDNDEVTEFSLKLFEVIKNTLTETDHFFGASMIKRICSILYSAKARRKHHINDITENELKKLYQLQELKKSKAEMLQKAQADIEKLEEKLNEELIKFEKRIKRNKHANGKNKRKLLNKKANVEDKLNEIRQDKERKQHERFLKIRKDNIKEMKTICGKRNRGNPNGIKQKYDPDGQRWLAYIIDPNNMTASSHDRTLSGCILEKNGINGLNNILDDFSCYYDIKLYIEKKHKIVNDLPKVIEIYESITDDIWDKMGDEVFTNRIKSRSTFSEYYNNRNKNTIQGKRLIKLNKNRSLELIVALPKGKTFVRKMNVDHWYTLNDIKNVNVYYLLLTDELGIKYALLCVHIDAASTKKYGTHDSEMLGWNNKKSVIPSKNLDKKIFGMDKSSEFGSRSFFLKPIACGFTKGSGTNMGDFKRQSEAFLQFCVVGPAVHVKADAYDMINVIEIAHLDGAQDDTIDELFIIPENDELKELGLEFTLNFLNLK